jgi:hypothetical protein
MLTTVFCLSPSCSAMATPAKAKGPGGPAARAFGDHMSKEGEVSHIPIIIRIMYLALAGYSLLASAVTGSAWFTQILFYLAFIVCFYLWHWMAHQSWTGKMYEIHTEHHWRIFPPSNFYGDEGAAKTVYGIEHPTIWDLLDPRTYAPCIKSLLKFLLVDCCECCTPNDMVLHTQNAVRQQRWLQVADYTPRSQAHRPTATSGTRAPSSSWPASSWRSPAWSSRPRGGHWPLRSSWRW